MTDTRTLSQLGSQDLRHLQDISQWGLPSAIVDNYRENGVEKMFPWQVQCLLAEGVLHGKNLVYSAPTSAGKTLVAELLMLKRVLETRKKAIMILPFVSVTREKMFHFQNLFCSGGLRVGGYMGSHFPVGGFQSVDMAVCTIEKANALVNKLLEEDALDLLCCVVVDELHMLGEPQRGYLLELLLTKLLYYQRHTAASGAVQLIGMSATLPNLHTVAGWLRASLFRTDYRPVPLTECVKVGTAAPIDISTGKEANIGVVHCALPPSVEDSDGCLALVLHTVSQGFGVLVFMPTKRWCEKMSQQIARTFLAVGKPPAQPNQVEPELLELGAKLRAVNKRHEIQEVLEKLRQTPAGLDETLKKTIPYGVAFHHAGLTYDERDIIENAFKAGIINVLAATSTLSSGVNLPARRVVIRTPIFGRQVLDVLTYKQMIGRAGRKGIDDRGESILVCKDQEQAKAMKLATTDLPPVNSCLGSHGSVSSSLKRAILEVVAAGVVTSLGSVMNYVECTFLSVRVRDSALQKQPNDPADRRDVDVSSAANDCIEFLVQNDFIKVEGNPKESGSTVSPTKLGQAVLASSLSPDQALLVLRELDKSRQSFVLENDLHIIYEVTPHFISEQASLDYAVLSDFYHALGEDKRRVASLVGFDVGYVYKCIRGAATTRDKDLHEAIHRRFYVALALDELVQEVPLAEVCTKFGLQKGMLQNLQQSAATFAGMMAIFCKRLGWHNLELLISQFQKRLHFGVQQELCELLQLVPMTAQAARILFNAGFIALPELARASLHEVEAAFHAARSYQAKEEDTSTGVRWIYLNGFDGVTEREAARILIDDARKTLHDWLGVKVDFEKKEQPLSQQRVQENEGEDTKPNATAEEGSQLLVDRTLRGVDTTEGHVPVDMGDVSVKNGIDNSTAVCVGRDPQAVPDCPVSNGALSNLEVAAVSEVPGKAFDDQDGLIVNASDHSCFRRPRGELHAARQPEDGNPNTAGDVGIVTHPENERAKDASATNVSWNTSKVAGENSFQNGVQHYSTPNRSPKHSRQQKTSETATRMDQTTPIGSSTASSTIFDDLVLPDEVKSNPLDPDGSGCDMGRAGLGKAHSIPGDKTDGDSIFDGVRTQETTANSRRENAEKSTGDSSLFDEIVTQPDSPADHESQDALRDSPQKHSLLATPSPSAMSGVRVTPNKLKLLEEEGKIIRMNLRSSLKRGSDEEVNRDDKKARPGAHRSLTEVFKFDTGNLENDSMTSVLNNMHTEDIGRNTTVLCNGTDKTNNSQCKNGKSEPIERDERQVPGAVNDSDLLFDLLLTCQQSDSTTLTDGTVQPHALEDSKRQHTQDMTSTLTNTSTRTQSIKSEHSDSDLFSEGENGSPPCKKKPSKKSSSSDNESSIDLHLTPSQQSSSLNSSCSPQLASQFRCIRELMEEDLLRIIEEAGSRYALSLELEKEAARVQIAPTLPRPAVTVDKHDHRAPLIYNGHRLVGFSVAVSPNEGVFYPLSDRDDGNATLLSRLLVEQRRSAPQTVVMLDCLNQLKAIMVMLGIVPDTDTTRFEDPGIAHWLLDSSICSSPPLELLCNEYCPKLSSVLKVSTCLPQSCVESCASLSVLHRVHSGLKAKSIPLEVFRREMRLCVVLAHMDLNGFGYDDKTCEAQINAMRELQFQLETKIISRAKRTLKASSSTDVSRAIYSLFKEKLIHLKLITGREPPNKLKLSSKAILLKLAEYDPLPQWIVDARKIASILAKDMFPILRAKQFHSGLGQHRIYTCSSPYTSTGRVALNEPNLQSMARNFQSAEQDILIRKGFVPMPGGVILSADFSQLEMRILAHLSNDALLCQMFSDPKGDVFVHVAARWKQLDPADVSPQQRQQAKELCYGIIYGKGVKSLADDLAVTEHEGEAFLQGFHAAFPGIQKYTSQVVSKCRQMGYIETMLGRRRYLPHINSPKAHLRAKAERQAVNSTIQGSAADLLKNCLIEIDSELSRRFPEASKPHRAYGASTRVPIRGAFIVMQLHDEIILEVNESILPAVTQLVRFKMERAISLHVPLVVKLKTGPHWSSVTPFEAL